MGDDVIYYFIAGIGEEIELMGVLMIVGFGHTLVEVIHHGCDGGFQLSTNHATKERFAFGRPGRKELIRIN